MENEPEGHKIFVGRLQGVDEADFVRAFGVHGNIISWSFNSERNFGFISYRQKEHAECAIEDMDRKFIGDRPMIVEWAYGWPREVEEEESVDDYERVFNMTCRHNSTIHCKGLTRYTTIDRLEGIFSPFGVIEEISLFTQRSDYAFIKFNTKEAATLAICSVNDTEIDGSDVKCSWSYREDLDSSSSSEVISISRHSSTSSLESGDDFDRIFNETSSNNRTVYCGGLEDTITNEIIEAIFGQFGIIESITLFNNRSDYGFIRFNTKEAAALAICSIDGTFIRDSHVRCSWSYREDGFSTERQQPSESHQESISTSILHDIRHLYDIQDRVSTQVGLGVPGAVAASPTPLAADKSQGAEREKKMDMLCKICMDEELGVVFLPCGHLTSCAKCAQKIISCPVCRRRITSKVRTYLS